MNGLRAVGAHALSRALHPGAWWAWALGLATAAARTTNPLLLALIIAVACLVVVARRTEAPWALAFRMYLYVAAFIVVMRVVFRALFNGNGSTVLFTLPTIELPGPAAGISLLGPVSIEALVAGFYDGLRLAAMIVCIGAANALANPKRLLAAMPAALHEIGTVIVIALSVFPQLAESVIRINRARMLRSSGERGKRWLREVVVPTVADALDRSLLLAAAMDSRGYGRRASVPDRYRRANSVLLVTAVLALSVGIYSILDPTAHWFLGVPLLVGGFLVSAVAMRMAGRRTLRTRYRPDPWRLAESLVVACGIVTALGISVVAVLQPVVAYPSISPLVWPAVSALALVSVLIGALPAVLAPPPPSMHTDEAEPERSDLAVVR